MKKILFMSLSTITATLLNFLLFIFTYNKLATPYLEEPQRMENADFIFSMALPGFLAIGLLTTAIHYLLIKKSA